VKAEAVAAVVGNGAAAAPGVLSDGMRGRRREERMRSPEVGDGGREGRYKAQNAEVAARCLVGKSEDERSLLPRPTWPPSAPPPSFPIAERRQVVLADDPCEAGSSGAGPEYAGMYLHARYFDPQLGTFLSADPIGVEGGINQYA
jgi:hypothetical protein